MSLRIQAAVSSNRGSVRKNNEDNFYFDGFFMNEKQREETIHRETESENGAKIYAICDGMGGEEAGEDASMTAVRCLKQHEKKLTDKLDKEQIKATLQEISNLIENNASKKGYHSGTTIAMVLICQEQAAFVNVGDSRIYCYENNSLKRISVDHSEVQRLFAMRVIKAEEMASHPKRHMITQYLGMPHEKALLSPCIKLPEPLRAGQKILICSDGLTDMVDDTCIQKIIAEADTAQTAVHQLNNMALENGGKDNITIICLFLYGLKEGLNDYIRKSTPKKLFWEKIKNRINL